MAKKYTQLSVPERRLIQQHLDEGKSISWIAKALGRHKSTISREIRRCGVNREYSWVAAQNDAKRNKLRHRLPRKIVGALEAIINYHLEEYHSSPQQISGRLKRDFPDIPELQASPESIYRHIYRSDKREHFIQCLRKKRKTRGKRAARRNSPNWAKPSISDRPDLSKREEFGHWEGDLILGKEQQSAMGTLVERSSRYTLIIPMQSRDSKAVVSAFKQALEKFPPHMRKSLTYDRGSEMAAYHDLVHTLKMQVYFADAGKPYQRGSNENTNGLIREYFPKKTDLKQFSMEDILMVQKAINSRPRVVLRYLSAKEVFAQASKDEKVYLSQTL